ncbi:MAG: hypothetical protein KatS3mg028_1302 [Bacteroidia bacterium]|nr:MAG: hypothetical protein KatS3mg028_1302 [Bacteroidia bacterium]
MENMDNANQGGLDIELPAELADGIYSNLAIISHSPNEFVIDFVSIMPGVPKGKVRSRIILTPQNAKRLLKAMEDNIRKFENINGKIQVQEINIPFNFGTPTAQA